MKTFYFLKHDIVHAFSLNRRNIKVYLTSRFRIDFILYFLFIWVIPIIGKAQNFRSSSSTAVSTGVTTITITKPTGTVSGDVMIAAIAVRPSSATITAPSGWSLIKKTNQTTGGTNTQATYYKVAGGSEPASYAWTLAGSPTGAAGGVSTFYNVNTATPINVENGQATASATTHATPTVTTTVANTMVIGTYSIAATTTWTKPTGMTESFDVASSGAVSVEMSYGTQAAAGATGTKTATAGTSAVGVAQIVTLVSGSSATINYSGSPYCSGTGTASVTQTGTTSGTYSSTSGLSINSSTGAVTLATSTAGTYTVTYTFGGATPATTTATITIYDIGNNQLDYTNGSHGVICTSTPENGTGTLTAPAGTIFTTVGFASYGTPTGTCPSFAIGACHATTSQSVTESYLLGNNTASIPATNTVFTDPCVGTVKTLDITATYTQPICSGFSPGTITGTTPTGGNGIYTYLWEKSTTSSTTGFSAASGTNNAKDYTSPALTQTTWYRRTVTSAGCTDAAVIQVTVVAAPAATISYAGTPYCSNAGTASVTFSGTSGGTYSSTTGLTINSATGVITLGTSTPGTYTVTYTMTSTNCTTTATASVTITALPVATFSYSGSSYCKNASNPSPIFNGGGVAGTFSSTTGLVFVNTSTGQINLASSTPGTYTVTNTIAASGGCAAVTATSSVTITALPVATFNYPGTPYCKNASNPSPTFSGGGVAGTFSSTTGLVFVNTSTGQIDLTSSTPGTYTVINTIAASGGCAAVTATSSVTIIPSVGTPIFSAGATSSRCKGAGSVTYNATAANSTSISYSLDASSLAANNTIIASTGEVTFTANWTGSSVITVTATGCNGPVSSTHTVTTYGLPSVTAISTSTCAGGSSGTITANPSGGAAPYTFSLNSGAYQSNPTFSGLGAGTYTLNVLSSGGCMASTSVTIAEYGTSTDDQTTAGSNSWIGHVYDGTNFNSYIGHYTENENFNQNFGGNTTCFAITSNSAASSVYTETFSVRYRMNSTKKGLYVADLGSDDGARLTVDGNLIYNYWSDNAFVNKPSVLMNLTGSSSMVFEYYENGGSNQIVFQNLTLVLANNLSTNATQNICLGNTGSAISGDIYGTLPSGITLSGTGYQWTYSTTPGGTRTNISGATGATFTPSTIAAPFNVAGTYYIYRNAVLSSTNNVSPNPYVATNESNAATITVTAVPSATINYAGTPYCSSAGTATVTRTGTAGGTYSSTTGLSINSSTGDVNLGASTAGTYTVTYTIAATGCSVFSTTATINITAQPFGSGSYTGSPYCSGAGIVYPTGSATAGGTFTSTAGLSLNVSTGAINTATSTAGTYTVTYTIAASGGCSAFSFSTPVTITTAPSATISYTGNPYCSNGGIAAITRTGTAGGKYSSTAGLSLDSTTGNVNLQTSTSGTYTVTYAISASGGCTAFSTTTSITIASAPSISQISTTNLIAYYPFSGNANDSTGNDNAAVQNSPALSADRFNIANRAYTFNGSNQFAITAKSYTNINDFTISIWFKTTTTTGGKLIGFGTSQIIASSQYDRHLYMSNSGKIYFGVYPSVVRTVASPLSYNDGNWHLASATLSSTAGMVLYMDGVQVGSDPSTTSGENYTGYWRIAYDNVNGWTDQPSSYYFKGTLDDALIYHRALSPSEVATLYNSPDGAGNNGPVCSGTTLTLTATTVAGATYSWTGPNGFTSALQNPTLTYAAANAGAYTLQVTKGGCTSTAYTNVVSSAAAGQWTGNISTDWADAGNWCSGVLPTSSTNVIITAGATRMPVISSVVSCNNITINSGASVTIAGGGNLKITGNLVNNGTYTDNGTTTFNGPPGPQTFFGVTVFNNLTINNVDGLVLDVAIVVKGNLFISTGTLRAANFNISVGGNWINNTSATAFTPGTATVIFNGTAGQLIGGNFSTTFNNLTISNTGSYVNLNTNINITGDLFVSSGKLDIGSFTANRATAGGTLTVYNNATLKIGGTSTFPINYSSVNLSIASIVEYYGTDQTVSNQVYGNLILSSATGAAIKTFPATPLTILGNLTSTKGTGTSVTYTAGSAITVNGNVSIGASTTFNGGSYSHSVSGNWTNNGTFNGNTSTITLYGTGISVSGAGTENFNSLTIAGANITFSANTIQLTGSLATVGSGTFNQLSGGLLIMNGAGTTISGTGISLDDVTINGTVTTAASFIITGNLSVTGSLLCTAGTITMSGSTKIISNTGNANFNILFISGYCTTTSGFTINSGLVVIGTFTATAGTITFSGTSSLSGLANLFNVDINGTYLQLSANSVLGIANLLNITSGILDVTSSVPNTVNFNKAGAQTINGITYNNLSLSNGNNKTASSNLTVNNNLTINTGTTFVAGSFTHSIYGDWINNGTFLAGTSTIQFSGPATSNIIGATTFNVLTLNESSSLSTVILQSNITTDIVNMIAGRMFTGNNTITITNTRTGNDIIIGNIQRTHAFTTGVAYAFEGPNNTITFSSVSSVNSITVSVVEGTVDDFPFGGAVSRRYTISVPSGTYNATLRLHYEDEELNGNDESSMTLWRYNGTSWASIGKTANSTTADYVEKSGLTDITNRWTFSDDGNVVQWNGSVSSDWNTPANWTVLQGSASRPPSADDIVGIGTGAFNNQPVISSNVSVRSIILGSAKAVTLSMNTGGSLTTGDISGDWDSGLVHIINTNNQIITINGNLNLSDGTQGNAINLNIGAGTVNIHGSLTQSGGANINFSGNGNLNIFEDFNYVNGDFNAGNGTVTYNGVNNQNVGNVTYNNVIINKATSSAEANNPLTIKGDLTVSSGEMDNRSVLTIFGNVTISPGGTLFNNNIFHVGGNWLNNGTYIPLGSSTYFEGTGTQTISSSNFNNLNIAKPSGTAVLNGNVQVAGDFNITSGTFDFQTYNITRDVLGGVTTISNGAIALIGGNNGPVNFGTKTLGVSSTVIYNGTDTQYISTTGINFGNVIFRNGGAKPKILVTPLIIKGDITIDSNASINGSSYSITLSGNWLNNGTFIPSTSEVVLAGASKTVKGVPTTFYKLSVVGSHSVYSNFVVNKMFSISAAGAITSNAQIDVIVNGDLINRGILITNGSATFTGNILQTVNLINATTFVQIVNFNGFVTPVFNSTSVPPEFGYVNVNNTGGVYPSVSWKIDYGMVVNAGASFNGGPSTHYFYGNLVNNGTITSNGVLDFIPSQAVNLNMGNNFSSTGEVIFGGTGAITLAGNPSSFHDVTISNTNAAGITPSSNWNITNNLLTNNATVFNAAGYSYIIGGDIDINGTLNKGTSLFTFNGADLQDIFSRSAFNNITVNKSSGVITLTDDLIVDGTLNFISGNIDTDTSIVRLEAGANLTGASANTGWVDGYLQKNVETGAVTKAFEVGDSINYTPATLTFTNVISSGDLLVSATPTDHPNIKSSTINPARSVNRYWSFENNGITFDNYTGTYNFVTSDVDAGATTSAFKVGVYNGSSWTFPQVASPNSTNIQATGVTSLGDIAIGEICNAGTAISYAASPYCSNGGTANVTLTGTSGGVFSSSAGLSLNTATGAVNLGASTPGTYSVTYTINATGECPVYITSGSITITPAPTATISYAGSPYCTGTDSAYITFNGTAGGVFTSATGLAINNITGNIDLISSTPGSYIVTYTVAAAGGCAVYTATTNIVITPTVSTPVFSLGGTSTRCQQAGTVTYTATADNSTFITYSLDAASLSAGNSINSSTGQVTYIPGWSGTSVITATATGCNGPATASHTVTINQPPSVTAISTVTCVGGSSGTIIATGSGGTSPYTYSLNTGTYQSSATFTGVAAGIYTVNIKGNDGCIGSTTVTVNPYSASADDQSVTATDSWVGHVYDGISFNNYIGHYNKSEMFTENFGGGTNCFSVTSNSETRSIYTETFSIKYRMNSTRKGLFIVDLGSDDGSRLTIDGTLVYNNWTNQSFNARPRVLISLNGLSSLMYEYYENTGSNQVQFQNLTRILENTLTVNTSQTICQGSDGAAISGDEFGTLPGGITLSGTGYQWTYSTTPAGTRINIDGATGATYIPSASVVPFNTPGTYYIYRNAILNSVNNISPNPYTATNESNSAILIVNNAPAATIVYTGSPYCSDAGIAYITFGGTGGGTYSSTEGLSINSSIGAIDLSGSIPGTYTVTYTVPATAPCGQYQTTTTVTIQSAGLWTGAVNTDWNNAGNWLCGAIPSAAADVVIENGLTNYPVISSDTTAIHNITVQSDASVTITDGTLQISGSINNSGSFDVTQGTVELNGITSQTIPGGTFAYNRIKNLVISNDVTLQGEDSVTGVLSFGNADNKTFSTGGYLTLRSTAEGTARVEDITNGGANSGNAITGLVRVERYIPANRAWRLLTAPVTAGSGQTIQDAWQEGVNNTSLDYSQNQDPVPGYGTHITWGSQSAAGFDVGTTNNPSLKGYNNATRTWDAVSNTNTTAITDYPAYMLFIRGDRSIDLSQRTGAQPTNTTLRSTGELKTNDQSYNVDATGFTVISNPYASPMDLNNIAKQNSGNIQDNFYVWDPRITGTNGVGGFVNLSWNGSFYDITPFTGDGISQYIQSGAAFLAKTADSTQPGTVVIKETDKTALGSDDINRPWERSDGAERLMTSLYSVNPDGTTSIVDGLLNSFDARYSDEIDNMDAAKLSNFAESLSTERQGKKLTVERRQPLTMNDTIYYRMEQMKQKAYILKFTAQDMQSTGLTGYLEDGYLKTTTPVNLEGETNVSFTVTSQEGSSAPGRFRLVFRPASPLPVTISSIKAWQQSSGIEADWKISNEEGIKEYEVESSDGGLSFTTSATVPANPNSNGTYSWTDLNAGQGNNYYRIKTTAKTGEVRYSQIVKVSIGTQRQQIELTTNVISSNTIIWQMINMPKGRYGIRLLDNLGQTIYTRQTEHTGGSSTEMLTIKTRLTKGIYMLEFTKPDHRKTTKKVLME